MVITPQTNIKLLKVPICLDEKNQITFGSRTAQYNYFNSLPKLEFDSCTYQRKDNYMAINEDADTLQEYNYCMYQNNQYDNKWFYAFITDISYQGNNVSYVTIKTDVYQTWLFECNFKRSFVEREHTNNDTIGANTIPENVELGEYICNGSERFTSLYGNYVIVMASTIDPSIDAGGTLIGGNNGGGVYGGVKSGYRYYTFLTTTNTLENVLKAFANAGKSEAIGSIFMLPRTLITIDPTLNLDNYMIPDSQSPNTFAWEINKQTTLNGYTPVNNKLLCYPYNYLYISNQNGGNAIYHYEKFSSNNCYFRMRGVVTPSGSIHLYPRNYNGIEDNYSELLAGAKYPICGFQNDTFRNWLTQNGLNISADLSKGLATIVGGGILAATGGGLVAGGLVAGGGLLDVFSTMQDLNYKRDLIPPQNAGNVNIGDVNFSTNLNTYIYYKMSIRSEYARVIDNYFSMFGYKTNRVKMPNLTGRRNWNYVKTINANVEGNIPQKDLQEIKNMFDKGVTLWHNPSTFLDYSQNNAII